MEGQSQAYRESLMEIFNNFKTKKSSRGANNVVNLKDIEGYFLKMKSIYSASRRQEGPRLHHLRE